MDAFLVVDGYAAEFLKKQGIDSEDQALLLSLVDVDTDQYVEQDAVKKVFERVLEKQEIFAEGAREFIASNYFYFAALK